MVILCGHGIDVFLNELGVFTYVSENDWRSNCVDCRNDGMWKNEPKVAEFALASSKEGKFPFISEPSDQIREMMWESDLPKDEIIVLRTKGDVLENLPIKSSEIKRRDRKLMFDAKRLGWRVVDIDDDYTMNDLYRDIRGKCGLNCCGCGKRVFDKTNYFMLHDELWRKICKKGERNETDVLCKRCCELILGRKLTRKDLNDAPVNDWLDWR